MTGVVAQLLLMLLIILAASELFTNALEHLGDRLGISEGVTGSLFAAVGTALPETMVPLLALVAGTAGNTTNEEIGTGAILGAPLMLSTLSTFLMAASVMPRRGPRGHLRPEHTGLVRDLHFFLMAFAMAALAMYVAPQAPMARAGLAAGLVLVYFVYLLLTLKASRALVDRGHGTRAEGHLWIRRLGLPGHPLVLLAQLGAAVALLLFGARGFIAGVAEGARALGVSTLLLSLLIIPIATELPEKLNSILWIRRGKDTLALGNITGAMVFQGTLLPAIGILFTPWRPQRDTVAAMLVTLLAAAWLRLLAARGPLPLWALMVNGLLYAVYLALALVPWNPLAP
jgi:cation:H+ antiporter